MTRRLVRSLLLPLLLLLAAPGAAAAQQPGAPLEAFVQRVATLWADGEVGALIELVPENGRLALDLGGGMETVNSRHAAAALRALFADRESVGMRAVRVAVSGGEPPRGFGELAWAFRSRSAPAAQTRSVFVGTVWEAGRWRINELRLMP
jgi:hypothetical protein